MLVSGKSTKKDVIGTVFEAFKNIEEQLTKLLTTVVKDISAFRMFPKMSEIF